jgi:hypothetical protein
LNYWRVLELLTLTGKQDTQKEVIDRASSIVEASDDSLFEYRVERLWERRNKLVHDWVGSEVDKYDINLLKILSEELILIFSDFRGQWDKDDFEFVLRNAGSGDHALEEKRSNREREIELIEQLQEFRDTDSH